MTFLSQNQECLRDSSVTLDLSESVQSVLGRGLSLLLLAAYSTFFIKMRVVVFLPALSLSSQKLLMFSN